MQGIVTIPEEIFSFDIILDNIDALVYAVDTKSDQILYINQKAKEEFGNILGQICYRIMQEKSGITCDECFISKVHYKDNEKWEHTNTFNNKTYLFSEQNVKLNDQQELKIQIGIDISIQKSLEKTIQEQHERNIESFETLTNATIEALLIFDDNKVCIQTNKIAPELFGYKPEEMIGKSALDFISEKSYEHVKVVIQNADQEPYEALMQRKDGSTFPAILRGRDMKLDNKNIRVSAVMDITQMKQKEEEIAKLAYYDSLTLLPNRTLLENRIGQMVLKSKRTHHYGALMFVDLDYFKTINDTKGHITGDMILIECASRLQSITRDYDTISRFGGDEFVVLIDTQTDNELHAIQDVTVIAQKILKILKIPFIVDDSEYLLSASIGISMFNDAVSGKELMKRADSAMYVVKENGKDSFSFFDPKLQEKIERKAVVLERLREAIKHKKIEIHYQKQVDVEGNVVGLEALARWNDEVFGFVPPVEFIKVAEQSGLIIPFGNFLLEEVASLLQEWKSCSLRSNWRISINISLEQFEREDFYDIIKYVVDKYNIDAQKMRLEITESLLLKDAQDALVKINKLKELGITISIDDFGTGYSSLSYLKKLPVDELKIDKSFIDDILNDKSDETIVSVILSLAKEFGFDVIAEGVEHEGMYTKLRELGCKYFQGYYFSKPLPKSELVI